MLRSDADKENLRNAAKKLIAGDENLELAKNETTGEDDFKYAKGTEVCAAVVDLGSGIGYAQVTGGGKPVEAVYTGRGKSGYTMKKIELDQTCMLYGRPTVLYVTRQT